VSESTVNERLRRIRKETRAVFNHEKHIERDQPAQAPDLGKRRPSIDRRLPAVGSEATQHRPDRAILPRFRFGGDSGQYGVAARKLEQLDSVSRLEELRIPPGNRLEALSRERKGQYSIRINEQYRVCFVWTDDGPDAVEITDYH
jgi:plasmid maintenance system killer protein